MKMAVLKPLEALRYKRVKELEVIRGIAKRKEDNQKECAKDCPFKSDCCYGDDWELGRYDPFREVVELYVDRIRKVSYEIGYCEIVVRDVVRIHENIHSYTHQRLKGAFFKIPRWVNEAVTQFLTKHYIHLFFKEYEGCFNALNRRASPCYQAYTRVNVPNKIIKQSYSDLKIFSGLFSICRTILLDHTLHDVIRGMGTLPEELAEFNFEIGSMEVS